MELALDVWKGDLAAQKENLVSILVFVELALDVPAEPTNLVLEQGFNPCFRGTCS